MSEPVPERPRCDGSKRCGFHHAVVGVYRCCCGLPWVNKSCASGAKAGEPVPERPTPDPFAAMRPLWEELDRNHTACSAALAANDWQAWAECASRGAEIFEELARLNGWRTS